MTTLYALCRRSAGLVVKRVVLSANAQTLVMNTFNGQYKNFTDGVRHQVAFQGDWTPKEDEVLTLPLNAEALALTAATQATVATVPPIDAKNFEQEQIKGLLVEQPGGRILIQNFSTQQLLLSRASLILDGQTFKAMDAPAFSIGTSLVAVIEGQKIHFKSFAMLSRIIDLSEYHQAATDADIDTLAKHKKINFQDVQSLKDTANLTTRKSLHAILNSGVLDKLPAKSFETRAAALGIALKTTGGKLQIPSDPASLRDVLHFLKNEVYEGPLDKQIYVANAKRRLR